MRWKGRKQSSNVVDKRKIGKGISIIGFLVGAAFYYFQGGDPLSYVAQQMSHFSSNSPTGTPESSQQKEFIGVVLADTEDIWSELFRRQNLQYKLPQLVLFSGQVSSACGRASASVGPFYCPSDKQLYLDLSFFNILEQSLGASGDFAKAYVIAHEVGHHVQTLLGLETKLRNLQRRRDKAGRNELSVNFELQADCLAGVWAGAVQSRKAIMEDGDFEEAMEAAAAVGDDAIQKTSRGEVVPDSFTHGSSEQRKTAFNRGFQNPFMRTCL